MAEITDPAARSGQDADGVALPKLSGKENLSWRLQKTKLRLCPRSFYPSDPQFPYDHFTSTRATPFTVLVASTGLPSSVTSILRTM